MDGRAISCFKTVQLSPGEFFFPHGITKGDILITRFLLRVYSWRASSSVQVRRFQSPSMINQCRLLQPAERHLANIRQLTFGRQNAEAYFSFDGAKLIFQSTNNWMGTSYAGSQSSGVSDLGCYQMYTMDLENERYSIW